MPRYIWLGLIRTNFEVVCVKYEAPGETHEDAGLGEHAYSYCFRYTPEDGVVYWWLINGTPPERYREEVERWLRRHAVCPNKIRHRAQEAAVDNWSHGLDDEMPKRRKTLKAG